MADPTNVDLPAGVWTEISAADTVGYFTNNGPVPIQYAEGAAAPTLEGHPMSAQPPGMNFTLTGGQKLYAKSNVLGKVAVTLV